jgi:uncharacterized protein (TIGR02145 family)
MKKFLFGLLILYALKANAQNYLISFSGTGASSSVTTVNVENLTAETTRALSGEDILQLNIITGINSKEIRQSSEMKIYPNPMTDYSILEIYPPKAGDATISIYDMTGKQVTQIHNYLENSVHVFKLAGLKVGSYLIEVKSNAYQFSGKLLCSGETKGMIRIEKIDIPVNAVAEKKSITDHKGVKAIVDMPYTTGDRLKFTGISGIYSTVKTDIPTQDKTITFNFINCTDGDNINYPVVEIGTQIWMAENLKTTRYRNGDLIGTTTPATKDISGESTPKYQWPVGGTEDNVATYGRLYTWYAVTDGLNVCPTGWHVPIYAEWTMLTSYLGGEDNAGGKLKETGTNHWNSPNTGANNEYGFTALPGGTRGYNGTFNDIGKRMYGCSSTDDINGLALVAGMSEGGSNVFTSAALKSTGFSVRCLYGTTPSVSTTTVTTFTSNSAIVGGNVLSDGNSSVTERGVYWGTSQNLETTGTKLQIGSGNGSYSTSLSGLNPNTDYYVKAYATNSAGTSYGNEVSFKTTPL